MDVIAREAKDSRAPDAFAPVAGFRRFGIIWSSRHGTRYLLVKKGHPWTPRAPTVAECRRPGSSDDRADASPRQACGCGLHAWLRKEEALRYYELTTAMGWVLAPVIGWGRVYYDEDSWRPETAQVTAFADPSDTHTDKPEFVEGDPQAALGALGSHAGLFKVADYARSLVVTTMEAHDRCYPEQTDFDRTIAMGPIGVGTTEFDLSGGRVLKPCASGRAAAEKVLGSGREMFASSEKRRKGDHVRPHA